MSKMNELLIGAAESFMENHLTYTLDECMEIVKASKNPISYWANYENMIEERKESDDYFSISFLLEKDCKRNILEQFRNQCEVNKEMQRLYDGSYIFFENDPDPENSIWLKIYFNVFEAKASKIGLCFDIASETTVAEFLLKNFSQPLHSENDCYRKEKGCDCCCDHCSLR